MKKQFQILLFVMLSVTFLSCTPAMKSKQGISEHLDLTLSPPSEKVQYKGIYYQKGDSALGQLEVNAESNIVFEPSEFLPINSLFQLKIVKAAMVDPASGRWKEVRSAALKDANAQIAFKTDQYALSQSTYDIDKMPLSLIDDLWALPKTPIKPGETYTEKVLFRNIDGSNRYSGVRKITLQKLNTVGSTTIADFRIQTTLKIHLSGDKKDKPILLKIDSAARWDIGQKLPLGAEQTSVWSGKVKGETFEIKTSWKVQQGDD